MLYPHSLICVPAIILALTCASGPRGPQLTHVPSRLYLAFDNAPNPEAIGRKLREFNAALGSSGLEGGEEAGVEGGGFHVLGYIAQYILPKVLPMPCAVLLPDLTLHVPHRSPYCQHSFPHIPAGPLDELLRKLPSAVAPGGGVAGVFTPADLSLLHKLLQWPKAQLFPALDVARAAALDTGGAASLATGNVGDLRGGNRLGLRPSGT